MEPSFLKSLVIIFGVSGMVVFLLGRLKMPSIAGFLIAGMILGPHGFEFIRDVKDIELLAEIGVILLMFTIGLEFSLKNLLLLRSAVFGGGLIQISLTIGIITVLSYLFLNKGANRALFNGFLISLSSTAIVMKLLLDRAEINTPYGRMSMGILIFQDLCVIPFMLFVPILAGNGSGMPDIAITLLKASLVIGAVLFAARWGVPHILHQVVSSRSRELFVISIIFLCLGTALLTYKLGLSLALGAFLAGIIISESEYASQAISDILPFKESFTGLFFISIGMLMNLVFFKTHLIKIVSVVIIILILKGIIAAVAAAMQGQSLRNAIQTGLYLSQIGEFSFVLAVAGRVQGIITVDNYQIFLSASVLTMLLTPLLISSAHPISAWFISMPLLQRFERMQRRAEIEGRPAKKSDHVIIVGFGVNGRNLARVLRESDIPYVVLEINSDTVRRMRKECEPIYYGDGTSREILHKLGIHTAKVLVIAITDAAATRRVVQIARKENPHLYIIVRTRYVAEVEDLKGLGANEVIPEEFETSIEIFSRVLHHYHTPRNAITEYVDNIRKDSYGVLRTLKLPQKHLAERHEFLKGLDTETYLLKKGSDMEGHSLKEINLRGRTGVTIIAVQRGDAIHQNPSSDFILRKGDIFLLIGKREDITRAIGYFESEIK